VTAAATSPSFSQVKAGITGYVKMAPLGTAVPTDVTSSWAAGWIDLGALDDKGIADSMKYSFTAVAAWQSPIAVRQLMKTSAPSMKFTTIQFNWATIQAWTNGAVSSALGGGVFKVSVPPTVLATEIMLGVEFHDGALAYRKWFNRGMITDASDITIEKGTALMPGFTYTPMPIDLTTDVSTFLTNDPSFASS
jgi:hypothetical protein